MPTVLCVLLLFATAAPAAAEEPIRLVVRGDDFGYTHASNAAMEKAFRDGIMTSASVLVPGPWFTETAAILNEHPAWSVGVHLTITSEWNRLRWRPVSAIDAVPSLVAPDGYLWAFGYSPDKPSGWPSDGAPWAEHLPDLDEVEREFRAQIEKALAMGLKLDYVDCHMGMACRERILPITKKLAKEFCLGISSGVMFEDKRMRVDNGSRSIEDVEAGVIAALEELTPGQWLYVAHPAADSPELRAVDSNSGERWAKQRSSVLAAWTSPRVRAVIERRGIELVSMRDLFHKEACAPR